MNIADLGGSKERKRLFITHVDAVGPYLRISGHLNPDAVSIVRNKLHQLLSTCYAIDPSLPAVRQQALLRPGTLGLYKRTNGAAPADCDFLRARVCNVIQATTVALGSCLQVEVDFIDYGYMVMVSAYELLFPQHPELLESIPPLCTQYIVLGICADWNKHELDEVSHMLMHQTLEFCVDMEFDQQKFITMIWKEFNFAEFLIHQKKIGAPLSNSLFRDNFKKLLKIQQQQQQQLQQHQQQLQQQLLQQQQLYAVSTVGGSILLNNNNIHAHNNNINTFHQTNNNNNAAAAAAAAAATMTTTVHSGSVLYPTMGVGVAGADAYTAYSSGNQMREEMAARRSLAARLQQHQTSSYGMTMQSVQQPRIPQSVGNLRSMMQGMNSVSNRLAFAGQQQYSQHAADIYNGYNNLVAPTTQLNAYNARYQRPFVPLQQQPQQQLENSPPQRTRMSATFKSTNLTVGRIYDVCVSFVENGPCLFSVQLVNAQNELTEMMTQIEKVQLKQFSEKPMLGTACIARYSEDGQLYRALITGVQATACKVAYIDYGNAELVNFRDLYEIPQDFLSAKAFAIRFTLSGHKELEPIDESLKKAFKDLVIYKTCKLKVMPLEGPPLVQYCELFLQEKNILDVLKQVQKCRLVYAKAEPLQNNDIVEIRYIDSPKHFYVQKVSNIEAFEKLMDDMFLYYNKNQLVPNHLALGAPCIVKYENEWYRAEVMRADATAIIVRHVDFGYEQMVTKNLLSTIAEKHLKLPRQAVQCCLKGFENNELNKDLATTQFEMLAEESNRKRRSFTVKVFRIQPDGVNLVNLCTKDLNVMKKLYKLSMPFEQYLSLEKDDFNIHPNDYVQNGHAKQMNGGGSGLIIHKAPSSIASSTDVPSINSGNNKRGGNILNSTALHSDERYKQQPYNKSTQQPLLRQAGGVSNNNRANNSFSTEWDKNSSASSSVDNRDSRSSSSEYKQQGGTGAGGKRTANQQRQRNQDKYENRLNVSLNSSDRRSIGSGGSGNHNNKQQRHAAAVANNLPPRFQRQQDNDNRRNYKSPSKPPPQQQQQHSQQRSQNAPQGFSQPRQKLGGNRSPKDQQSSDDKFSSGSEQTIAECYMPFDHAFPRQHIETPAREDVTICWWVSPHQFYTHLKSRTAEFESFMRRMYQFYKNKPQQHLQLRVGSYVVARYRKDNILYRARIIACNQMLRKYKVLFVDFGSQYTVSSEDIWQVEKRFADFPCMAYLCAFNGIISNVDHLMIIDRMEKYLPTGSKLTCEYIERIEEDSDLYYVNVNVNNMSLRETLKLDGLITDVCPELRLDLLPGQQIRAKVSSIKDMLNFKIQIEGCDEQIKFLCSYNDVRYVKSTPDVAQKFKQFYEGKSCVINITDVTDNKVILLRPMLPLLTEDIPTNICTYPIILESFEARVVYVASSYRLFVHMLTTDSDIVQLLNDMYTHYQTEALGVALKNFDVDQICAAHGSDDNWYRARIVTRSRNTLDPIEVYYIDYGNKEKIDRSELKCLDEKFYHNKSAYAIEINLPIRVPEPLKTKQNATKKPLKEEYNQLFDEVKSLAQDQTVIVKAVEMRRNRLIADIYKDDQSLLHILKEKHIIKGKDLEAMRKLIDKEKANVLEYIETVDLTLEDEDEPPVTSKKSPAKSKAPSGSPKKKSVAAKELFAEKTQEASKQLAEPQLEKQLVESLTKLEITEKEQGTDIAKNVLPVKEDIKSKPVSPTPTPTPTPNPESESEDTSLDPYADMEHAALSHCDNPTRFFVHPQHKLDELHQLQENLQIVANSLPPLMSVVNGAHCISHYSVDKQWYRAKIMDAELMVIQFIDYGNTDALTDTTDIKEMSVFPNIEPFCIPCALPIKPNGTADWVDAANAIFNDSYKKVLHYEYITRGDNERKSYIRLFIDGVDIADKLIKDGFAKPLQLVQSGENCYISHVNGLSDFYIQYEKDSKALELIEIYLADNEKLTRSTKFERNKIVAALFPDDGNWYRAKQLRELPNEGYEVLFIDYGNTSISPECREISEDIADLPPLSKPCSLELPKRCISWSDEAENKFSELSALGETIFTVELCEPAPEHAIVKLLIDGHNIVDDLSPLCEHNATMEEDLMNSSFCTSALQTSICDSGVALDAIIAHANSPNDFYIQFNKDAIRLEDMTHTLNSLGMEQLEQPSVGQLCAAVFADDNALYRARILELPTPDSSDYRVLFIDFGNEAISVDLRTLPQDLLQLKPFARHCQLEDVAIEGIEALAAETFNVLIDECQGLVRAEILQYSEEPDQPAIARILAANNGENIAEKLKRLLNESVASAAAKATTTQKKTCIISHADSPRQFYIQLKENSPKMELIAKALQRENIEKSPELQRPDVGSVCSVFAADDDCYYRGRVEQVLAADTGYEIFLLDHGYTINATLLRELSDEMRAIPALALKCQLSNLPEEASEAQLEEHFAALMEAHFGEFFEIVEDVVDSETRLHTVKLSTASYKDLAEELTHAVESGSTHVEVLSPVPTLHNCSVIHVNSPTSFYIQLAADVPAVEQITDILLDAETDFAPFTELAVGAICAAQFPDDLAFYRARILSVLDGENAGKCEVHYLDFGNNAVTDQFRALPPDMLQLEGHSKHCALEKYAEMHFNNADASAHFQALIDSRFSETFQVELLNTIANPIPCRLFYQDKNVATELQQLLKEAAVNSAGKMETEGGEGDGVVESTQLASKMENGVDMNNPSSGIDSMEGDEVTSIVEQ